MDLDVNMRTGSCPYAVQFYGALFREVGGKVTVFITALLTYVYHFSSFPPCGSYMQVLSKKLYDINDII